jgi:hypothetical protein
MVERVEGELIRPDDDYSALVIIVSDGMENHSGQWQANVPAAQRHRAYSSEEIQATITRLEGTGRWTFTFLGADLDLHKIAATLGLREKNVSGFVKSKAGMAEARERVYSSSHRHMEAKMRGLKNSANFWGEDPTEAMPQGGPIAPPAATARRNSINVIKPYQWNGVWVFDDPARGLDKEPLVAGVPEIIDAVCAGRGIRDPQNGFVTIFSAAPFPGAHATLEHLRPDESGTGNWYRLAGTALEGWLCPALLKYFAAPPARIFIQVKNAQ